jgi:hypothetical protein
MWSERALVSEDGRMLLQKETERRGGGEWETAWEEQRASW